MKLHTFHLAVFLFALTLCGVSATPSCPKRISPTLCAQRYDAVKAWILRSRSVEDLNIAFSQYASNPSVIHTVQDVGDFVGYDVALEYDYLTVGLAPVLGYAPVILRTTWEPATTKWVTPDIIQVDYFLNASTLWNPATNSYDINVEGMRYRDWFTFDNGTAKVNYDYGIQDAIGAKIFTFNAQSLNAIATCGIIFQACNRSDAGCDQVPGGNCIGLTQFPTFYQCTQFVESLISGPPNKCPYPLRSNTRDCRALHGMSSFFIPTLHCTHVPPVNPLCRDDCLDGPCAQAVANAKCVAEWPNIPLSYEKVYKPVCVDGYSGDGLVKCEANTCSKDSDCPDRVSVCDQGLCKCPDTWMWDPSPRAKRTRNTCVCPPDTKMYNYQGKSICIRIGQCLEASQCPQARSGQPLRIQCRAFGTNPYSQFKQCLCNHGYVGGVEYPCECPNPRREVYSATLQGNVCIGLNECVSDAQCDSKSSCMFTEGAYVGTCLARTIPSA